MGREWGRSHAIRRLETLVLYKQSLFSDYFLIGTNCPVQSTLIHNVLYFPQSIHRVAIADGNGLGVHTARSPPFSLLPSRTKLHYMLLLRGQIHSLYFISTIYVLCDIQKRPVSI